MLCQALLPCLRFVILCQTLDMSEICHPLPSTSAMSKICHPLPSTSAMSKICHPLPSTSQAAKSKQCVWNSSSYARHYWHFSICAKHNQHVWNSSSYAKHYSHLLTCAKHHWPVPSIADQRHVILCQALLTPVTCAKHHWHLCAKHLPGVCHSVPSTMDFCWSVSSTSDMSEICHPVLGTTETCQPVSVPSICHPVLTCLETRLEHIRWNSHHPIEDSGHTPSKQCTPYTQLFSSETSISNETI